MVYIATFIMHVDDDHSGLALALIGEHVGRRRVELRAG